ncbi:MAG: DUF3102 domain-containing protein [Oscillospiraceae bacterium]|nr:DUF3102 domain-containing protein [Oscillospiraceae bacterium]
MKPELVVTAEYNKAVLLDRKIKANAQAAQESLYEVCKGLKEMRDGKLYKELGYQNFEDYSENEVGIKRHMAYKYCSIAEIENVEPVQHLGITKLSILAKLDEQEREDFIQNNNVEDMSKRELEAQIKQLKKEQEKMNGYTRELSEKINEANREKEEAEKKAQQMIGNMSVLKTDKEMLTESVEQLKAKIKELEERPVEVAVSDNSEELEKLREEYEDKLLEKHGELMAQKQMTADNSKAAHEAIKEVEELKKQLAEKPKEIEVTNYEEQFEIYLNNFIDAKNRLKGFVKLHEEYRNSAYVQALRMMEEFET